MEEEAGALSTTARGTVAGVYASPSLKFGCVVAFLVVGSTICLDSGSSFSLCGSLSFDLCRTAGMGTRKGSCSLRCSENRKRSHRFQLSSSLNAHAVGGLNIHVFSGCRYSEVAL